jgi:hypothetical protein
MDVPDLNDVSGYLVGLLLGDVKTRMIVTLLKTR